MLNTWIGYPIKATIYGGHESVNPLDVPEKN